MDWVSNRIATAAGVCRPASAAETVPALRMVLAADGRLADEARAADFVRFTAGRGVSLTDVWVVTDPAESRLLWAALPMFSPGRTMLLLAAPAAVCDPAAMRDGIDAVCRRYAAGGQVQLAQVLLDPADSATGDAYVDRGFADVAELLYLGRLVRRSAAAPPPVPAGVRVDTYAADRHAAFAAAIAGSYVDSLDCPLLNGVRPMDDVIAGHMATGIFDPAEWFLLTDTATAAPVGVLLLARTVSGDGMELVYLGLAPAGRGRGLGDLAVRLAVARSAVAKVRALSLAVDARNGPALALYHRHGFKQVASRRAMMRTLSEPPIADGGIP